MAVGFTPFTNIKMFSIMMILIKDVPQSSWHLFIYFSLLPRGRKSWRVCLDWVQKKVVSLRLDLNDDEHLPGCDI